MSASGLIERSESSGVGTTSFRCNITNHYFYFRFIAFVNCDVLGLNRRCTEWPSHDGRTSKKEATHDRPKTQDCAGLHGARSHASADGMLEIVENAGEDGLRQAGAHATFCDQGGREDGRPGGADDERGRVSGDTGWLCAGIFAERRTKAFARRADRRGSRGQRFCAGGREGCAFHARLPAGASERSGRKDGSREAGGDSGTSARALGDGLAARTCARSL